MMSCLLRFWTFGVPAIADADGAWWGLFGGAVGTLLGIGGGVVGTYFSIRNTKTSAERRLMIRYAVAVWLGLFFLVFLPITLSLFGIIPVWVLWTMFGVFFLVLIPTIGRVNRRAAMLRETIDQDGTSL